MEYNKNLTSTNKRNYSKIDHDNHDELLHKKQKLLDISGQEIAQLRVDMELLHKKQTLLDLSEQKLLDISGQEIAQLRADMEAFRAITIALSNRYHGCCYNS